MLIFGITGGSGAGKSTASAVFEELGVYVIDGDKVARRIVEPGEECLKILTKQLGDEILNADGTMNRSGVAKMVFSDPEKLAILNDVTHKYINREILAEFERENPELAAIDGAVIIGSPVAENCAFIVSVVADCEVRMNRIMARDNITEEMALRRISAQPPEEFYIENSKFIIKNDGDETALREAVRNVVSEIKKEYKFE